MRGGLALRSQLEAAGHPPSRSCIGPGASSCPVQGEAIACRSRPLCWTGCSSVVDDMMRARGSRLHLLVCRSRSSVAPEGCPVPFCRC